MITEHDTWRLEWDEYFDGMIDTIERMSDVAFQAMDHGHDKLAAKLLEAATELIRHCRLCEEFLARQTVAMTAKIYKQNPVLKKLVESEAWAKTMVPASPFTEMVQRDDKPTP